MNNKQTPTISILIPMLNEQQYISACLDSILANNFPVEQLEILVIDGLSTDNSPDIVRSYKEQYNFIHLLKNHRHIQSVGLNLGLQEAKGEIIIRMDTHTIYAPDYIGQCVSTLKNTQAVNVGGVQTAVGKGYITDTIAIAKTSPFGVGDARFRYSKQMEYVDTVYLGTWYKSTLEELGGFNNDLAINEDYELNYRLRKKGGKILLNPAIKCQYHVRDSLTSLARQYFRYGLWKVKMLNMYPEALRWRQLVPPFFIIALLVSFIIIFWFPVLGLIVPILYVTGSLTASVVVATKRHIKYLPLMLIVFAIMHLGWGLGFWLGVVRFGLPRLSLNSLDRSFKNSNI